MIIISIYIGTLRPLDGISKYPIIRKTYKHVAKWNKISIITRVTRSLVLQMGNDERGIKTIPISITKDKERKFLNNGITWKT